MNGLGRPRPIDHSVFLAELRGLGDLASILWHDRDRAQSQGVDDACDERCTQLRQAFLQLAGCLVGPDRGGGRGDDSPSVDARGHPDDGDAGFGFSILDGAGHRGCAAIGRQDRPVEVDAAQSRDGKERGGEDLSVCGRDQQIRLQASNQFQARWRIDILGLQDEDPARLGGLLDQARDDLLLAALRPVRLSHKRDHVMPCLDQVLERGQSEVARPQHHESERRIIHGG